MQVFDLRSNAGSPINPSDAEQRIAAAVEQIGDELCGPSVIYIVQSTTGVAT